MRLTGFSGLHQRVSPTLLALLALLAWAVVDIACPRLHPEAMQITHPDAPLTIERLLPARNTEAETEGYFALGQDLVVIVKPKSDLHKYFMSKSGQRLRIVITPLGADEQ